MNGVRYPREKNIAVGKIGVRIVRNQVLPRYTDKGVLLQQLKAIITNTCTARLNHKNMRSQGRQTQRGTDRVLPFR